MQDIECLAEESHNNIGKTTTYHAWIQSTHPVSTSGKGSSTSLPVMQAMMSVQATSSMGASSQVILTLLPRERQSRPPTSMPRGRQATPQQDSTAIAETAPTAATATATTPQTEGDRRHLQGYVPTNPTTSPTSSMIGRRRTSTMCCLHIALKGDCEKSASRSMRVHRYISYPWLKVPQ